jgi:hypothetical protein
MRERHAVVERSKTSPLVCSKKGKGVRRVMGSEA